MAPLLDLVREIFEEIPFQPNATIPFAFYYAPVIYLDAVQWLYPIDLDPRELNPPKFELRRMNQNTFRGHPPNKTLDLRYDEEYLVYKAKKRPVIAISPLNKIPAITGLPQPQRKSSVICLPIYSLYDTEGLRKPHFTEQFIKDCAFFQYKQFFFLEKDITPISRDSIIRLDRCMSIMRNELEPSKVKLTKEAADFLLESFIILLDESKVLDKDIRELIEVIQTEYK